MMNEEIKAQLEEIKYCSIELMKDDLATDYFVTLVKLDAAIKAIEKEVTSIEAECERQKNQASKLRIMWGNDLDRLCDEAGIE